MLEKDGVHGGPDLTVEILSPWGRKRDLVQKRRIYAACQVNEYWIVDPESQEILVTSGPGLRAERTVTTNGRLTSRLFPGLELKGRDVFRHL